MLAEALKALDLAQIMVSLVKGCPEEYDYYSKQLEWWTKVVEFERKNNE